MTAPKNYELVTPVDTLALINAGFEVRGGTYTFRKELCKYSDNQNPYVVLRITIESGRMTYAVSGMDGSSYAPFYNPNQRHDNLVYDIVVRNFNKAMDSLVKKNILVHKKKVREKHGRTGHKN